MSGSGAATADTRREAVAARLAGLGPDAGARLVADLWTARGYATDREGRRVRASRDGGPVTVDVRSPPRFGRLAVPEPTPDVLVVLGSADSVAPDGVRVVDAAELAELLLYAVDRPVARELCERHLGAAPAELRLPPVAALRRRVGTLPAPGAVAGSGLRVGAFVLAAVLVAVALAALGGSTPAGTVTPGPSVDAAAGGGASEAAAPDGEFPATYPQGTAGLLPPGVSQSGLEDPVVLGSAHRERLAATAYTLTLTERHPAANASATPTVDRYLFGSLPGPGVTHTTEFRVEGDSYRSTATLENAAGDRVRASVYFDGRQWFVAAPLYGNTTYRSSPVAGSVGPVPEELTGTLVERYLTTPETATTGVVERDGARLYRLTATGTPEPFPDPFIRNYTAVALVDSRGLVRELSVRYAIVSDDARTVVERSLSYSRFGEASAGPPPWYINRFDDD